MKVKSLLVIAEPVRTGISGFNGEDARIDAIDGGMVPIDPPSAESPPGAC